MSPRKKTAHTLKTAPARRASRRSELIVKGHETPETSGQDSSALDNRFHRTIRRSPALPRAMNGRFLYESGAWLRAVQRASWAARSL
jgi:hypothetical protein